MSRGKILGLTREQALQRALSQLVALPTPPKSAPPGTVPMPIAYRLDSGFNGGSDPDAPHCASWSYGDRRATADCVGFVLWASGVDRMQPGYKGSRDEWLNCGALLDDADGAEVYCRLPFQHEAIEVGDWLVSPDHIGFIIRPDNYSGQERHLVLDCSPYHDRTAHAIDTRYPWHGTVVLKPTTKVYLNG